MELVLHAVAARVDLWTHHLDPDHIASVWAEVRYLDGIFLQNQNGVGGHITLAVIVLQEPPEWESQLILSLNRGEGEENKSSIKRWLTFLRYISS